MKKLFGFLIFLLAILLIPLNVFAVDYSIENMQIHAFLKENGDVHVTEEQTYSFEGEFNGITRTLIPKTATSIIDVEASENDAPLEIEREDNLYKIYRGGQDESVTITLSYTITDGINVYEDVGEFYWAFFDTSNESTYQQLDVFVHPPHPADDVIAFGYDAAEDTALTESDGVTHFAMGEVQRGTKGDIRVAYEATLFPQSTLTKDKPIRDEILAAKNDLKEKRETFVANQRNMQAIAPYVAGIFMMYMIGLLVYARRKKQMAIAEVNRFYPLPYFVPEEEMSLPATIAYTNAGVILPETISAALLDLVRKGNVVQEGESAFQIKNEHAELPHEQFLIDWLFYKIGRDGKFQFDDLQTYTKKKTNHSTYNEDFSQWQQKVQAEVKQNELTKKKPILRWTVLLTSMLILPFTVLLIMYELFGYMSVTIFLFLGLLSFAAFYRPKTMKGLRIKRDWLEFQHKYVEMHEADWEALVDDEQKRAFIYGIGIDDKRMNRKNEALLERVPNELHLDMNPILFLLIAANMNIHFNSANEVTSAASSSSGTAGVGTGVGTGVGGGGGGSGAF